MKPIDESASNIAPLAIAFECGLGLLALVLGWIVGHSPLASLLFTPEGRWKSTCAIGWGLLGSVPPLVAFLAIHHFPVGPFRRLDQLVTQQIVPLFRHSTLWELGFVSVAAGIGEELLFRGLIQDGVSQSMGGAMGFWIGLGLASSLFGLCHALNGTYALLATAMAFYLGVLFLVTDSIVTVIVTHSVYDFVALVVLVRQQRAWSVAKPIEGTE